jgi:hypothetical protein
MRTCMRARRAAAASMASIIAGPDARRDERRLFSVLPHREPLGPQPGGELRLHARGNPVRQARIPFHEIEPEPAAMSANEAARLCARAVSLEARIG